MSAQNRILITKKNEINHTQNIIFKPIQNKKLVNFVLIFRIGVALTALFSLLVAGGCGGGLDWTKVDTNIINQAIQENTFISSPEEIAQVRTTVLDAERDLVLVDYKNDKLCGLSGCLYNLYLKDQKIWSKYLQPLLPPKTELFILSEDVVANLPCLNVNQYNQADKSLTNQTYCFDGESYKINQSLS